MALILPQKVKTKWTGNTRKHYESKGYVYTKNLDEFEVNVEDLPYRSKQLVDIKCDYCGKLEKLKYYDAYRQSHGSVCNKICCSDPKCKKEKASFIKRSTIDATSQVKETAYRNKDWLYNQYIVLNKSAEQISKEIGINLRTLRRYIRDFGITIKADQKTKAIKKEELYDLYVKKKLTTIEIGALYNVGDNTVSNLLRKFNIPVYSQSERMMDYYYKKGGIEKAREIAGSKESRILNSCRHQGITRDEFNGFARSENLRLRGNAKYFDWRKNVFERDNYTCQCCGQHGGKLNAHHIKNFSDNEQLRYDVDNGITLCFNCHSLKSKYGFHRLYGTKNNTKEQLDEYIKAREEVDS